MAFSEEKALFVQEDGFATEIEDSSGTTFQAIVDKAYRERLKIAGEAISLEASSDDAGDYVAGDELLLGEDVLEVVSNQPGRDAGAFTVLRCARRGKLATFQGEDDGLAEIWIDETRPLFPLAQQEPGEDLTILTIKNASSADGHLLLQIGPLGEGEGGPIPDGATIWKAEFRFYVQDYGPHSVAWSAFKVLPGLILSQANWNQYRSSYFWDTAGAQGADVDYDSSISFGSGATDEIQALGYHLFLEGDDFASALQDVALGSKLGVVIHDSGIWAWTKVYSSDPLNSAAVQPTLKVWYDEVT